MGEDFKDAAKYRVLMTFREWDADQSGSISQDELTRVLLELGMAQEVVSAIFTHMDTNEDGSISYLEFVTWLFGSAATDLPMGAEQSLWGEDALDDLLKAVFRGDEDKFVRYLTRDKLLTVDARDTDGTTLLMAATKGGRLHLVRKILDMRCTLLNVADKDGNTALDYACAVGKEQVIEYMTVGHVKHSNTRVPFLKALLPAILRGDVESVQQSVLPCIEYQIYIDRHMEDVVGLSWTPCGKAELLVNKVSEGLVYTWNSKNPDAQVRAGDRIVKVNDAEGDYHALQFELGKYQEATIVLHRHLLDEGLDPNAKDDRGSPLLHHAVKTGNPKLVEALMAGDNVEINQTDKLGRTALDVAEDYKKQASEDAQSGWDEVIGLLKKSNAKRSSA